MDPAAPPADAARAGESLAGALARIDREFGPVYLAALAAERLARIEAFAALPPVIGGIECRPLNLWHLNALLGAGNPFIGGGVRTPAAAAALLWLLSPSYAPRARLRRWRFVRRVRRLGWAELLAELEHYLDGVFAECELPTAAESGDGGNKGPLWCLAASLVHVFGRSYGWTREQTMGEPLDVLFQLRRLIHAENNPDCPLFNPRSGAVRAARNRARAACREEFAALAKA